MIGHLSGDLREHGPEGDNQVGSELISKLCGEHRLGERWEWSTSVLVMRKGNLTKSGLDEVDETEIYRGDENTLSMQQTYTHEFQCVYQLMKYPFDTQVSSILYPMSV